MNNISLIGEWRSRDTIEAAGRLLEEATDGKIVGMAFVVLKKRRRYGYGFTGAAYDDPITAIGGANRLIKALLEHEERLFMNSPVE